MLRVRQAASLDILFSEEIDREMEGVARSPSLAKLSGSLEQFW